jgi:hypothetical protein
VDAPNVRGGDHPTRITDAGLSGVSPWRVLPRHTTATFRWQITAVPWNLVVLAVSALLFAFAAAPLLVEW